MSRRRKLPLRPTDAELEILHTLWRLGPATVRQVHGALGHGRPVAYTTVLKLLQIMTAKGLARRDESERSHVYAAAFTEEDTQQRLLEDLMDRAFDGSAQKLLMRALAIERTSREDLLHVKRLLGDLEREKGGK